MVLQEDLNAMCRVCVCVLGGAGAMSSGCWRRLVDKFSEPLLFSFTAFEPATRR